MDIIRLIQRKVPIGSKACFTLKNGKEISGVLIEISHDHITLESNGSSPTIFVEMIGAFDVIGGKTQSNKKDDHIEAVEIAKGVIEKNDSVKQDIISSKIQIDISNKLFEIETRYNAYLKE